MAQVNGAGTAMPGAEDDRHGTGPMRRTGTNRFGQRPPGPYDRPNKDARNGRGWNAGGRLSPPRAGQGGRGQVPNRFSDGGASAMGPREAVQGRSLKSYEDLDAAGGSATGALDY